MIDSKTYQAWVTNPASGGGSRKFPKVMMETGESEIDYTPRYASSNAPGLALGVAGEAGEVAEVIKKSLRGGGFDFNREHLLLELGDVLWYLVGLADTFGWSLEDVMEANYQKIEARRAQKAPRTK